MKDSGICGTEEDGVFLTMLFGVTRQSVFFAGVVDPRFDKHEIGNEGWDLALQDGGVTPDYVLVFGFSNVVLVDDCIKAGREINHTEGLYKHKTVREAGQGLRAVLTNV